MKKTIQNGFALLLLLGSMNGFSQESPNPNKELQQARLQLMEGYNGYNPQAALATYQQQAAQGNAEAMNGLGLIYSRGMGVPVNEALALEWFTKAGQNGYPKAYYNLGKLYKEGVGVPKDLVQALAFFKKAAQTGYNDGYVYWGEMYKDGLGTPQDYSQAMTIFKEGANKGSAACLYAQGYLHYKGFGTQQDYSKAIQLFEQAAQQNNTMGIYMLGYCYRNGYGVAIDAAKAKSYFTKAAALGLERAKTELAQPQAENATPTQVQTLSTPLTEEVEKAPIVVPQKLQKVKQKITKGDISGLYTGRLLRYDWSGQNILTDTPIEVSIQQEGKVLTGIWLEKQGDSIAFQASIEEKNIVFKDTKIDRLNRSLTPEINSFRFKNAKLQIVDTGEEVYLVGNLQLYNIKQRENEKPMYLILERPQERVYDPNQAIVSKMVVYPNPVTSNSFKLSFDLAAQTPITIKIYDMVGLLKHQQNLSITGTGLQEQIIDFAAPAGNYILNLFYNDQVARTILIKQ